jgi:hypothetical protein
VAGKRRQGKRGGCPVGEQKTKGAQRDRRGSSLGGKVVQQPGDRFKRRPDLGVVDVGQSLGVLAPFDVHQADQFGVLG